MGADELGQFYKGFRWHMTATIFQKNAFKQSAGSVPTMVIVLLMLSMLLSWPLLLNERPAVLNHSNSFRFTHTIFGCWLKRTFSNKTFTLNKSVILG